MKKKYVTDGKGNEFDTLSELCAYYNIDRSRFLKRIENGKDLQEALLYREPSMRKKDVNVVFGDKLLEERIHLGIKQTEFGQIIGNMMHDVADQEPISAGMISAFENGRKSVGIERLKLISDYFKLPIDYMLGLYDYRQVITPNDNNAREEFSKRLLDLRLKSGKTQLQVCKEISERKDINIKSIINVVLLSYEKGNCEPAFAKIIEFCKYYNCSVAYIMGQTDNPNEFMAGTEPEDTHDEFLQPFYSYKELN